MRARTSFGKMKAALFMAALCGCAGTMTAARTAYERGDFLEAARLADARMRENPDDDKAGPLRAQAREKALAKLAADERAARARGDGEGASSALTQLLQWPRAWELSLSLDLGGGAPVVARIDATTRRISETSSSAPRAVTLADMRLPSAHEWLQPKMAALEENLVWELARAWYGRHCAGDVLAREQAARCLYGANDLPAAARAALSTELGEDGPRLVTLVVNGRSRRRLTPVTRQRIGIVTT